MAASEDLGDAMLPPDRGDHGPERIVIAAGDADQIAHHPPMSAPRTGAVKLCHGIFPAANGAFGQHQFIVTQMPVMKSPDLGGGIWGN